MPTAALVQGGVGVIQAGIGIAQSISGNKRLKRLLQQREDYKTPDEVGYAFQMAQNEAQGQSAATSSYFTNQTSNALTSSLDAAKKLGGNPNDIAAIFSRNIDAIMKNVDQGELKRFQSFDRVYSTLQGVAQGEDAEFADRKAKMDDMQAAEAMKVKAGNQNLQGGINGIMGAVANNELSKKGKEGVGGIAAPLNVMPPPAAGAGGIAPDYAKLLNWRRSYGQQPMTPAPPSYYQPRIN